MKWAFVLAAVIDFTSCALIPPSRAESASLSRDCATTGDEAFRRYKERRTEELAERYLSFAGREKPDFKFAPPEFHFNSRLNTCLMSVEYSSNIDVPVGNDSRRNSDSFADVIDVYANRVLIRRWDSIVNKPDGQQDIFHFDLESFKFYTQAKKLMEE